jgi:hypothetical protein
MTRLETEYTRIRLYRSDQTFYGTDFVLQKTRIGHGGIVAGLTRRKPPKAARCAPRH